MHQTSWTKRLGIRCGYALIALLGSLVLGSCAPSVSGSPDAATDVNDPGNPTLPRSTACERLATTGFVDLGSFGLCPPEAAEGSVCRFAFAGTGRCYGVGGLSGGYFASYERSNRVPKICMPERRLEPCGDWPNPDTVCLPTIGECRRVPGITTGPEFRCLPYHCN
ncbi:MAG: hypothetical protein Q8Q09_23840 [Deltaproteobacteria bacterium]|nr:hypothetical protein [Deltaproteobacteria bacterium]